MATIHPSDPPLKLDPGVRVCITQAIVGREKTWTTRVEGTVISCKSEPTGSWYAHGKNGKLWLQRVQLRKDDGEITTLVIGPHSKVQVLSD